jgi:hypothetical protein
MPKNRIIFYELPNRPLNHFELDVLQCIPREVLNEPELVLRKIIKEIIEEGFQNGFRIFYLNKSILD